MRKGEERHKLNFFWLHILSFWIYLAVVNVISIGIFTLTSILIIHTKSVGSTPFVHIWVMTICSVLILVKIS